MAPTARNHRYGSQNGSQANGYSSPYAGNAANGEPSRAANSYASAGQTPEGASNPYAGARATRRGAVNSYASAGQTPEGVSNPYVDARATRRGAVNSYASAGQTPEGMSNPYVDARTTRRGTARTAERTNPRTQESPRRANPYAASQEPRTQTGPSKTPVPSPPQQNPYLPQGSQAPILRRRKAKGRVATPNRQRVASTSGNVSGAAGPSPYQDATPPKSPRARRQRKPATHGGHAFLMWLVMLAVLALMGLRLMPANLASGKMVPEAVSFVPLALIPSAICLVLALLWRRRLLVIVCIFALAVNGYWHAGYFVGGTRVSTEAAQSVITSASTSDSAARIMTLNTKNGAASARQIVEVVREQHVEVLCLQELTDGMVSDLEAAGIDELLPYHVVSEGASAINNGGRNGIWTATSQSNISRNLLPIQTSSMPAASITIGSTTVRIVSVHPNSPVRGAQDLWDEGLSTIGTLSDYNHAYLIMGDFNSTWDHARFRELLGATFADAGEESGQGFHMTYPSNSLAPSLIEIDHIVYSRDSGIVVSSLETVTISGTDHQALLGTLEAV